MRLIKPILLAAAFMAAVSSLSAATIAQRLSVGIQIINDKQGSMQPIPQNLINNAKAVAIVKVSKAGLVFGGAGGQGIVVKRLAPVAGAPVTDTGGWSAPSAFDVSGGSFGAQVGFETLNFVILINSDDALKMFVSEGKAKWDATAAGTLGDGAVRESESELAKLPVIVYQSSDGVFGGATFGGTSIGADLAANKKSYGELVTVTDILSGKTPAPAGADVLYKILNGKR